jgi:ribosomal 30S subunit maturation factor RimM
MSEKQFCPKCEYYFSEMFTCPICYGEQKATERIIKLLETQALDYVEITCDFSGHGASFDEQGFITLIKRENK